MRVWLTLSENHTWSHKYLALFLEKRPRSSACNEASQAVDQHELEAANHREAGVMNHRESEAMGRPDSEVVNYRQILCWTRGVGRRPPIALPQRLSYENRTPCPMCTRKDLGNQENLGNRYRYPGDPEKIEKMQL